MKQSLNNRLRRTEQARAPEPAVHFIWPKTGGPSYEELRDALFASGKALPTDQFVRFSWRMRAPDKDTGPPDVPAGDDAGRHVEIGELEQCLTKLEKGLHN